MKGGRIDQKAGIGWGRPTGDNVPAGQLEIEVNWRGRLAMLSNPQLNPLYPSPMRGDGTADLKSELLAVIFPQPMSDT